MPVSRHVWLADPNRKFQAARLSLEDSCGKDPAAPSAPAQSDPGSASAQHIAPGKVNLYVGKTAVKFNIPEAEAVDRLKDLIREHGKWVEPAALEPTS